MNHAQLILMAAASTIGIVTADAAVPVAATPQGTPMKTLVVYYSFSGNTERAAQALAETLPAELLALEDVTKPTRETCYGAGKEACREGKSWPIKPLGKPVADYDRLFNVSREEIATQTKALATPFLAKPAP